jgi:poly-beta-1,6-N-acetyl-D-glucosamine synthase
MVVIFAVLSLYCIFVVFLWLGWQKASKFRTTRSHAKPLISILIPVRNEETNLGRLLETIHRQQYTNYELIIIDDHSEDGTYALAAAHTSTKVRVIKNQGQGKKRALTTGIAHANGTIIVTTDADCKVGDKWLGEIALFFDNDTVQLAFGGVRISDENSFFSSLQSIEFASLIGSGAATVAWRFPTMCNGANLAYRKTVFETVGGYEGNVDVASGDDEFLMRKVHKAFPGGICFLNSPNAVVETPAQPSLFLFLQQRLRWASKWRYNSSFVSIATACFILVTQCVWLISLGMVVLDFSLPLLALMVIKTFLEACFLASVCQWLGSMWKLGAFVTLQIIYAPYVVVVGILSSFITITWKGRNI